MRFERVVPSGAILAVLLVCVAPAPAGAQCVPPDEGLSAGLHSYAIDLATASDSVLVETRDRYGILPVPESEVEIVTDKSVCKVASRSYKQVLGLQGKAPPVTVIRVGTRYMVVSHEAKWPDGEFLVHVIFDSDYNKLASFAG